MPPHQFQFTSQTLLFFELNTHVWKSEVCDVTKGTDKLQVPLPLQWQNPQPDVAAIVKEHSSLQSGGRTFKPPPTPQ